LFHGCTPYVNSSDPGASPDRKIRTALALQTTLHRESNQLHPIPHAHHDSVLMLHHFPKAVRALAHISTLQLKNKAGVMMINEMRHPITIFRITCLIRALMFDIAHKAIGRHASLTPVKVIFSKAINIFRHIEIDISRSAGCSGNSGCR
jgi:hypothetical protein